MKILPNAVSTSSCTTVMSCGCTSNLRIARNTVFPLRFMSVEGFTNTRSSLLATRPITLLSLTKLNPARIGTQLRKGGQRHNCELTHPDVEQACQQRRCQHCAVCLERSSSPSPQSFGRLAECAFFILLQTKVRTIEVLEGLVDPIVAESAVQVRCTLNKLFGFLKKFSKSNPKMISQLQFP